MTIPRRTTGPRSGPPGRSRTRCAAGRRGRCSGQPRRHRGRTRHRCCPRAPAPAARYRAAAAAGWCGRSAARHPRFFGRCPAEEVGVGAPAGGGAAGERADAEDRAGGRRAEIEVDVTDIAALQGTPVHDVATGTERPVPPLSEVAMMIIASSAWRCPGGPRRACRGRGARLRLARSRCRAGRRSNSLARRSFAPTTWKVSRICSPVSLVPRSRSRSNRLLRLGQQLPGASPIQGRRSAVTRVTLAAATSTSMTRSVWYQDGMP